MDHSCIFSLRVAAKALITTFFMNIEGHFSQEQKRLKKGSKFSKQPKTANLAISASSKNFYPYAHKHAIENLFRLSVTLIILVRRIYVGIDKRRFHTFYPFDNSCSQDQAYLGSSYLTYYVVIVKRQSHTVCLCLRSFHCLE